jgi:hypothetical protein
MDEKQWIEEAWMRRTGQDRTRVRVEWRNDGCERTKQ